MPANFSVVIRPTGDASNVFCEYCSFNRLATTAESSAWMSTSLLEQTIATYMQTNQPVYRFAWEGGEPALLGTDFFQQAMDLQQHYRPNGAHLTNAIQTNATLITSDFAQLLAAHHFGVEVLLDGPADLHDRYRRFESDEGSHDAAIQGVDTLREAGIEPNIVVSVTNSNVSSPKRLYRYLKGKGLTRQHYEPLVGFAADGTPRPWSVTSDQWGEFLKLLFDTWCSDPEPASIRQFDAIMQRAAGGNPTMCSLQSTCRQRFVIQPNGDVYPCEVYLNPEMRLGNITTETLEQLWMSDTFRALGSLKRTLPRHCKSCGYVVYCRGGCPKERFRGAPNPMHAFENLDEPPESVLCDGWGNFFSYALSDLEIQGHERL